MLSAAAVEYLLDWAASTHLREQEEPAGHLDPPEVVATGQAQVEVEASSPDFWMQVYSIGIVLRRHRCHSRYTP